MPWITLAALVIFIMAKLGIVPSKIGMLQLEIVLFLGLAIGALIEVSLFRSSKTSKESNT